MDLRAGLAAVLGIALGLLFVAYPEVVVRAHAAGRRPHGGRGEYGSESAPPERWRQVVRGLGVVAVLAGLYFGTVALS